MAPGQPGMPGGTSGNDPALDAARQAAGVSSDQARFLAGQHHAKAREAMDAMNDDGPVA